MCRFRATNSMIRLGGFHAAKLFCAVALSLVATMASAHELWTETDASAEVGQEHAVHVCWGHAGQRETGDMLASQQDKLTACLLGPGGRDILKLAQANDHFVAKFTPQAPGIYVLGADLQVGIIDQELHGIPAKTKIVMYGKSLTCAGTGQDETIASLGFDLEIVPVDLPRVLKPGDMVTVRVLHKGKPIGGRNVLVSAATSGPLPPLVDPRIQSAEWKIEAMADPKTGEATFPLIVGGQHVFQTKYIDETPGTYDGVRNDNSDFSHLRKGDTYERTMFVSTLTIQVRVND